MISRSMETELMDPKTCPARVLPCDHGTADTQDLTFIGSTGMTGQMTEKAVKLAVRGRTR